MDYCNETERTRWENLLARPRDIDVKPLYTYLCPVIIFICFFSIISNAILIGISRQSKVVNKSPIILLSLNLAVTDLTASLLNGLSIFLNSYLPEVHNIKLGLCFMIVFELFRDAALVASALHLLALAFVHYRGIVNPLHYRSTIFFSQHLSRTINFISIACWLIPLVILVCWFSSIPCQAFQSKDCDYMFLLSFRFRYTLLALFALPLLLMLVIYLRIFIIISRHQRGHQLNHERSTLMRGMMSASGPVGTATTVNLPDLMAAILEEKEMNQSKKHQLPTAAAAADDVDEEDRPEKQAQVRLDRQASAPTRAMRVQLAHNKDNGDTVTLESSCDIRPKRFRGKLSRANTIGTNASRLIFGKQSQDNVDSHELASSRALVTMTLSGRQPSISSLVETSSSHRSRPNSSTGLFKLRLKRTPTSISNPTGSIRSADLSRSGIKNNSSVATSNMTVSSSTYEPQRRHIHAAATPQSNTKALVTTLLILGTYFISYIPVITLQVLTCLDNCPYPLNEIIFSKRLLYGSMTTLLLIVKSIIDPFIYLYRMSEIQVAITRYFSKKRSRSSFATSLQASQRLNTNNVSQTNKA